MHDIPTLAITFHNIVSAIFRDNMRYYAISADIWRYWPVMAWRLALLPPKVISDAPKIGRVPPHDPSSQRLLWAWLAGARYLAILCDIVQYYAILSDNSRSFEGYGQGRSYIKSITFTRYPTTSSKLKPYCNS